MFWPKQYDGHVTTHHNLGHTRHYTMNFSILLNSNFAAISRGAVGLAMYYDISDGLNYDNDDDMLHVFAGVDFSQPKAEEKPKPWGLCRPTNVGHCMEGFLSAWMPMSKPIYSMVALLMSLRVAGFSTSTGTAQLRSGMMNVHYSFIPLTYFNATDLVDFNQVNACG